MITLQIKNVWTVISGDYDPEVVDAVTRYHPEGYIYMPRYKKKRKDKTTGKWVRMWDGYNRLYAKNRKVFPTGLLGRVTRALRESGYEVRRVDERVAPEVTPVEKITLHGVELRDNQLECIETAAQRQRGVIQAATGFGKTEVMCGLCYRLNLPTLILVHKQDLLWQTWERMQERLGVRIGAVGDNSWETEYITVATFQTLYNAYKTDEKGLRAWLKQFAVVFVDESHHITTADTFTKILKATPAFYRFGFSATPFKEPPGSELALIAWTGEKIYDFGLQRAISEGIAVQPHCFMLDYDQKTDDDELAEMKDYAKLYTRTIVENNERNNLIASVCANAQAAGLPTAIIVERIEHGKRLSSLTGFPFLSGKHDAETRGRTLEAVNSGEIPGIISTLIDEGVDVPNLACIILAAGGKAPHRQVQRIGRGVRRGKHPFCIVVDFADDYDNDILNRQVDKRLDTYQRHKLQIHRVQELPDLRSFYEG